jgi:ceramide glucosyltransferase
MISWTLSAVLLAMVLGATCYSVIALYAAHRFRKMPCPGSDGFAPAVSLLKPLSGMDRELERNLESFCRQNYPSYEILFSVREETDPAVAVVGRLQKNFPAVPMKLLVTGPPRYLNAKVHGLEEMAKAARHEILVISDSDVRVGPDYLGGVVAPLGDPEVGMATCLSRVVAARSFWSVLEALGVNTQFLPGVLSAWLLIGMEFSLGPTMVTRKQQVEQIGGFGRLGDYLADDFVLGELISRAGYRVVLAEAIPDHLFGGESMRESLGHRLRWERSSRCSRPAGYWGQIFTHSLPLVLLAWAAVPGRNAMVLGLLGMCLAARALLAWEVGWRILGDDALRKYWWLLPLEDLLSFGIWCWAFAGEEIVWRGARLRVLRGGKLESTAATTADRAAVGVSR